MSMPALLSHFGIDTERFVTTSGQIVFSGVSSNTSGSYEHPQHGAVSPVAPHTFHGGTEEPIDSSNYEAWWDDQNELSRHREAMQKAFPEFLYFPAEGDAPPCWIGDLNSGRGTFRVGIVARADHGLPFVKLLSNQKLGKAAGRRWIPSPHLYLNGNLCIADQSDWRPEEHTIATAVAWTAHWIAAYTEWRFSRQWPVEGVRAVAT